MRTTEAMKGFALFGSAGQYSPETMEPYLRALARLAEYLGDPEVGAITETDLLRFFAHLRGEYKPPRTESGQLSEASMHRYWKAVRAFFKWTSVTCFTGRPDLALTAPKCDSKEITPFSREEVKSLLAVCEVSDVVKKSGKRAYRLSRPTAQRDKGIIRLLLDTGIRVGELCRLRVVDVNLPTGMVSVLPHRRGKTRPRVIPLGDSAKQELWMYLAQRRNDVGEYRDTDPLFVVETGGPVSRHRVESMITYLAGRAHIPAAHPHRFRHTFAIEYLRGGGDVFTLQYILGHGSMEMVRRYLQIAQMDVEAAHRRASPGDRWRL